MNEEGTQEESKSAWQKFKGTKVGKFCTDPAVAFFISMISLLTGIGGGYYFYQKAEKTPNLCYYVSPNVTTIVPPNTPSALKVSYLGEPITNGCYVVQLQVWNDGKGTIESNDILRQVTITPPSGIHILQTVLAKTSRDEIEFGMSTSTNTAGMILRWRILEQGDGGLLQIFYTGSSKDTFTVSGAVKGQKEVSKADLTTRKNNTALLKRLCIVGLIIIVSLLALEVILVYTAQFGFKLVLKLLIYLVIIVFNAIMVFSLFKAIVHSGPVSSPFGP